MLHQYPDMMPKLRCDQGAIKFVLSGANIMCPGLTSPGATIHDEVGCAVIGGLQRFGACSFARRVQQAAQRATSPCRCRCCCRRCSAWLLCAPAPPLPLLQVPEGAAVAIYAEGKEHAMALGLTKLSTEEIRSVNKGIAVELMHHLADGLWKTQSVA